MKLNKKILKKKSCLAIGAAVILLVSAGGFFVSAKVKMNKVRSMKAEAQSVVVQKGNISNTVEGTSNLEPAETIGITVPAGLEAISSKRKKRRTYQSGKGRTE